MPSNLFKAFARWSAGDQSLLRASSCSRSLMSAKITLNESSRSYEAKIFQERDKWENDKQVMHSIYAFFNLYY